jgi:hypothetical protein
MLPTVEIFEKFSDGSTLWRASVAGIPHAHDVVKEFAIKTKNECYAINCQTGEVIARMKSNMALAARIR